MPHFSSDGTRYILDSPVLAPQAGAYLWNRSMMVQTTCRGYAVAQFMQPEPAKYAHVPTLAGTSFMQPEQPFFAHHPGRFFYVRDDESGQLFSAPHEPVRAKPDKFEFSPGLSDIRWLVEKNGIRVELCLTLNPNEVAELWTVTVTNCSKHSRKLSVIPYFPVGYSSWMNLSADYDPKLGGIVARCVAPYQKVTDYFKRSEWKDLTYLVADRVPTSWEANQTRFEGEGGLQNPDGLANFKLSESNSLYEVPACVLHFADTLEPGQSSTTRLVFGPAKDEQEVAKIRTNLLSKKGFEKSQSSYNEYLASASGCITVETPDEQLNHVINHWLPRQVFYHGDTNRLCTDPQTRNYLQDGMGMAYLKPEVTRQVLLRALSQQKANGEMPDGILLTPEAELKYINQIPHTDHSVWLNICLQAYLGETGDWDILHEQLPFADGNESASVYEHLQRSMKWLVATRDQRGLSYIAQGDWCDPMNMVGYRGKGVSGWLTEAVSYALQLWAPICRTLGKLDEATQWEEEVTNLNASLNEHLWDGQWYARGITDDNVKFGVRTDTEGRIFLNAQSWALLCEAPDDQQKHLLLQSVAEHLDTPYGVQLLAPAYTAMRDDVGRVTQKFPGSGENGSVYNHAAAFYAASLYHVQEADKAFSVLRRMVPGPDQDDLTTRGQLPVYIPNYYRGAYRQHPRTAGRSSQLFNTGTAAWFYRLVVEGLFGMRGDATGLHLTPQLPSHWDNARATRQFRGATIEMSVRRDANVNEQQTSIDGISQDQAWLLQPQKGQTYIVEILLPVEA